MSLFAYINLPLPILGETVRNYSERTSVYYGHALLYLKPRYKVSIENDIISYNQRDIYNYNNGMIVYAISGNVTSTKKWSVSDTKSVVQYNTPIVGETLKGYVNRLFYASTLSHSVILKMMFQHYDMLLDSNLLIIKAIPQPYSKMSQIRVETFDASGNRLVMSYSSISAFESAIYNKTRVPATRHNRSKINARILKAEIRSKETRELVKKHKPVPGNYLYVYYKSIFGKHRVMDNYVTLFVKIVEKEYPDIKITRKLGKYYIDA